MSEQDKNLTSEVSETPLEKGVSIIRSYVAGLPSTPGVYRMLNEAGDALYVGKAKNLKRRVTSYTNPQRQSIRILRMIAQTISMEFIETHTEAEALLLEANLIKKLEPRYNILLRDDKSFPFIRITSQHDFPRVLKHRGAQHKEDEFFGPFASAWAVNQTLDILQQAFLLRTCSDSVFSGRTRPCLLHQIKRCSAPCIEGKVSKDGYQRLVGQARDFLQGKSRHIMDDLAKRMQTASDAMEYEEAAQYRDRIQAMARVSERQEVHLVKLGDADVIAIHREGGQTCIQVFFYRSGGNYGNRAYFPIQAKDAEAGEILEAFIGQFYANKPPPKTILLSHDVPGHGVLEEALTVRADRKVVVSVPQRGDKKALIDQALSNARSALARRMAESASQRRLLEGLAGILGLEGPPERIEVYDNSHVSGTNAVGAMIVAGSEGFAKNQYRKFNIKGNIAPGDDYAMAREVLTRRFSRALKEHPDRSGGTWPDLLLIDGGRGQLSVALEVFEELGIDDVPLVGIAKGPDRNAGEERLYLPGKDAPIRLSKNDPVLYFLQRLRDEAHRFAIGTHRAKRSKGIQRSLLDDVPGIGGKRKRALLHRFGSADGVASAGLSDLESVEGVSRTLAKTIYDFFHDQK